MKIINNKDCGICISDDDLDFGTEEDKYVYVYIAQLNYTNNTVKNSAKMKLNESDKIVFQFDEDGLYTICRIRIHEGPTGSGYYYQDDKFYLTLTGGEDKEVTLQEVVDANDDEDAGNDLEMEYEGFFSTCRLRKCFIELCKKIIDQGLFNNRCGKSNVDKDLIYQRDLVWSVFNTIEYLIEFGKYIEAQRLIERVNVCPGICHGIEKSKGGGCGCHVD